MNDILHNYLLSFLHPWHTQDLLSKTRSFESRVDEQAPLELVESREERHLDEESKEGLLLTFEQSLIVSWLFMIFSAVYTLIGMQMGTDIYKAFLVSEELIPYSKYFLGFTSIFFLILRVIFFPLIFWFYGKFWVSIIKMFGTLFEKNEENSEEIAKEIVTHAFTTHTFLVIPVIGLLLHRIANIVYIFSGLRRNMGFNVFQSTLVVLCPVLMILFLGFLVVVSFAMMLSGF